MIIDKANLLCLAVISMKLKIYGCFTIIFYVFMKKSDYIYLLVGFYIDFFIGLIFYYDSTILKSTE
jgi:hypothetical protein